MSIDRIGKGGMPPPPKPATETDKAHGPEGTKAFEIRPQAATVGARAPTAPATKLPATSPLERLRRGEVDLDGYLDLKVKEATGHLRGLLPSEIEGIRSMLRESVTRDPTVAALVQRATGELPGAKE
jgi:hypothetical protein